jgi:hypothetical protein
MSRLFGITVMPEWIQAEGIERVLDNLAMAGATAVATSPYVMAPSDDPEAGREPPIDAGAGSVRLLDRELWRQRELRCVTAPSFVPDKALYSGLRYQPAEANELSRREGPKVQAFIEAAKARGLEVHLQVQAAIPPGYRVQFGGPVPEDQPLLPDGRRHEGRVDKNGSLAAPEIRAYLEALVRDVAGAYPTIDALRLDWPEYPPYTLESWLFDFSPHAERMARAKGHDWTALKAAASRIQGDPALVLEEGLGSLDALGRFKADLSVDLLTAARAALPPSIRLVAHAFPPPWNRLSGLDYARVGDVVDDIAVKLYTMHWPMMLRSYLATMGRLDRDGAAAIQRTFDTGAAPLEDLRYPEPLERHPVAAAAQRRKIETARAQAPAMHAASHAYGPLDDVVARAEVAWSAAGRRLWINRYGYLSDAKLEALGRTLR